MWDHKILYTNRSSEDEQLLIRPLLRESKNTHKSGSWKLKFAFYFIDRTHELLHLDIPSSFIWIIISFDCPSEYGGISKFWCYAGTHAELLRVEFCNFWQCHVFVSYLSSYC
jgi:hypothetical protein